ncbi:hypothetical protein [Nocardia alni]|uniref:hypothetical protein n=1 Tax=Nocardia alni TaxID=2815723 RepID=UPI0020B226FD|nr:hypothetical protein [Nocardia alni]
MHPRDRQWIATSPFVVPATSDADGNRDASPKGDPAGFVQVLDDRTLTVPWVSNVPAALDGGVARRGIGFPRGRHLDARTARAAGGGGRGMGLAAGRAR